MRLTNCVAAVLLLASGITACDRPALSQRVTVEQAWVQLPVMAGRPGAAYFLLRSKSQEGYLTGVTSPSIGRIELHETRTVNGVSRMTPLQRVSFDDIGEIEFRPAGKHAMLFEVDSSVKPGDKISLTFSFESAPPVTAEAEVRAFGEGHGGH